MTNVKAVGNFETPAGDRLLQDTILDLRKSIAFFLAEERRVDFAEWDLQEFAAAIDLLALLGERNKFGPGVEAATVQQWRELYLPLYDQRYPANNQPNPLRENIGKAFDRLETLATLNPPDYWWRKDKN